MRTLFSTLLSTAIPRRLLAAAGLATLLPLTACISAQPLQLGHYDLDAGGPRFDHEPLALERSAEDLRANQTRVGRTTMSLFAITSGSVKTTTPLEEQVVSEIAEALESVGYEVELVDSMTSEPVAAPSLSVSIHEFHFKNYTWLMPYIRTWGDVRLGITLRDADGKVRLEQEFSGSGGSNCMGIDCGFIEASRKAMTEVLNQVIAASRSHAFRVAFETETEEAPAADVASPPPEGDAP